MSTAKNKAIQAIAELPDDADPQEIIKSLYRLYRLGSDLRQFRKRGDEPKAGLPPDLQLVDGLLVYTGPLGGIPDDAVAVAREERMRDILR